MGPPASLEAVIGDAFSSCPAYDLVTVLTQILVNRLSGLT